MRSSSRHVCLDEGLRLLVVRPTAVLISQACGWPGAGRFLVLSTGRRLQRDGVVESSVISNVQLHGEEDDDCTS